MKTRRAADKQQQSKQVKTKTKTMPSKLNIRTKLEIIARLKAGEKPLAIAQDCKIQEATVRYIRKNLKLIVRKGESLGMSLPEVPVNKPPDPCQVKMEQLLKEWIELHKVSLAHRELIREKAQVFYRLIRKENNMEDKECEVVHSGHWFKTFKNRFLRDKMKEVNSVAKTVMGSMSSERKSEPKKPKQKLKSKPKRIFLTFNDKLDIIHKLEEGQEPMELARSFNVSITTIRRVSRRANELKRQAKRAESKDNSPRKQKETTAVMQEEKQKTPVVLQQKDTVQKKQKRQSNEKEKESPLIENNVCLDKMEVLLKGWIVKHRVSLEVDDVILRKASTLYNSIKDENKLDVGAFKESEEWLAGFKERFAEIKLGDDEVEITNVENDKTLRIDHNTKKKQNIAHKFPFYEDLEELFNDSPFSPFPTKVEPVSREFLHYEHYKTKRHNSIKGNLRREGEFYYELEDLFDDDTYESITSYDDPLDFMENDEQPIYYAASPQERLQVNSKPQPSPVFTTPNSHVRPEKVATPQSNDTERDPDEVCLRWNSHHSNMKTSFPTLLEKEQYVDVTLCSEGQTIRCHRLILSSCSSYFDEILSGITPLQHPVIFLKGTPFWILKSLIDFMYVGEVHIEQAKLQEILEVAELLKIKGLTGKSTKNSAPREETPVKKERASVPTHQMTKPQIIQTTPIAARSVTPLKFVTKEQAANMQIVDPLSLLKPSYYEEQSSGSKKLLVPIRPKPQSLAEFSAKQKEWLSKKIIPKKKLKRKSTDHEPSPPPVILRKGTKSRPIVKAPKYYHMEYEQKKENLQMKGEDDSEDSDTNTPLQQPKAIIPGSSASTIHYDLVNVKNEPVEMDIEENFIDHYDENDDTPSPTIATPLIQITEPRTVSVDESNIFVSNPNSPEPVPVIENDKSLEEENENVEANKSQEEINDVKKNTNVNESVVEVRDNEENEELILEPDPEPECPGKELSQIDATKETKEKPDVAGIVENAG